ncbi:MAG: hypothetical protein QOD27_1231 [Microbacteriaceae bacterium]|nr:hypothetical protein [Microbacteriaceae bacterium]
MTPTSTDGRFRRAFAATVVTLVVLCSVFLALGYLQGAKLSSGQVDPATVVAQSGQQLRLFANQSVAPVTTGQVSVTPATRVTASSQGADISVQFADRLDYGTTYTVTIKNVRSIYGQRSSTFRYSFSTAAANLYFLDRAAPGAADPLDTIVQTGVAGRSQKVVYSARHIQSFAPFPGALAVVTLNDDNTSTLSLVSLKGAGVEPVLLPTTGVIDNVQSNAEAGLLGFTFSSGAAASGGGGPDPQYSNTLMTVDFNSTHTVQPELGPDGQPMRVRSWFFLPGGSSIVAQALDGSVTVTDPTTPGKPVSLGRYSSLSGSSPDGKSILVGDAAGQLAYSLSNGATTRLEPLAIGGVVPSGGDVALTGNGMTRLQSAAVANGRPTPFAASLVIDDGKKPRILYEIPGDIGSIESLSVSPNSQYVAIEEIPDVSASVSDGYSRDARSTSVATAIVDIATGEVVSIVSGFGVVWQ